jgi:hypothetical protein
MAKLSAKPKAPPAEELDRMHALYRQGGAERHMAPHVIYSDANCPHPGCGKQMQAIDFRLEFYGPSVHDPLVVAWWNDTGFAGRCPHCGGWIHFTIRGKSPIPAEQAAQLPKLPDDWHAVALIL